ncbi:39S ribosomal protein L45, mitochondrial isoform X2 [Varanus komodoensis]|uniref:39S ribosomal protein L45, mitochondrial isoform X2 n=1 Tax=Varanus komodoensis TaxID=61221 RepID=UPI001CF7DB26|nr:39S ribosomal protein L45, mitochondrial isoform X2 [Varanus komodoensis]
MHQRTQRASRKMAVSMRPGIVKLPLRACLQGVECLLNSARLAPTSVVVPVRTKRRHFIPPSVNAKYSTPEEQQRHARAAGIVIPHERLERPITLLCTAGIFDAYVPPEGDARISSLSKEGLKQRAQQVKQTAASQLAIRKIKEHDPDFSTKTFAEKAQTIFIEAHNYLANFDKDKLHSLVTERCYPEMVQGNRYKTIRWSFLESLEPPRVVHVRCPTMVNKENLYGQVTVRMHTRQIYHFYLQTLAIYDRFGRLMYGGEQIPKDVLEYVVFERQLVNRYAQWRLHGKIVPAWAPPKDPIVKTVMIPGPTLEPSQEYEEINFPQEAPAPQKQWHK